MEKYNFLTLKSECPLGGDDLPDDVDSYVKAELEKVTEKFPEIKENLERLLSYAKKHKVYTDKTRAMIIHPVKKIPLVTLEYHHGIVKQFSYALFFGESCYLPINMKNQKIEFRRGEKRWTQ